MFLYELRGNGKQMSCVIDLCNTFCWADHYSHVHRYQHGGQNGRFANEARARCSVMARHLFCWMPTSQPPMCQWTSSVRYNAGHCRMNVLAVPYAVVHPSLCKIPTVHVRSPFRSSVPH